MIARPTQTSVIAKQIRQNKFAKQT